MIPNQMQSLDEYLAQFADADAIDEISRRAGIPYRRIADMLHVYAAEARFGYSMVEAQLPLRGRILEVGSGLGMLSGYLKLKGYDVTPLEPCANGFDMFSQILSVLIEKEYCPSSLCVKAEELSPEKHGHYDLIFSVNVLEHIPDLEGAITGMVGVLAVGGHMVHACPNYTIPYEPHFAVPLIPFFPRATRWFLPAAITNSELWRSINFVTISRIRRFADAHGCTVTFRQGLMADSLKRLDSDMEFAKRHKGLVMGIYRALKATGMLKLIEKLPPTLSSPMVMDMGKTHGTLSESYHY